MKAKIGNKKASPKTARAKTANFAVACPHCHGALKVSVARKGAGRPRKSLASGVVLTPAQRAAIQRLMAE